jgi:hypothetical protein
MNNKPGVPFDLPELPVEIDYGELVEQIIHTKGHPLSKGGPLFTLGIFWLLVAASWGEVDGENC